MNRQDQINDFKKKVDKLNSVSPTFCLAKWKMSTTTLYNGMTASCHHPVAHKIKVEDIIDNPRGLHNTPTKLAARQDMLNGVQTTECDYCWNIENLEEKHYSDRHYKSIGGSTDLWEHFDEVVDSGLGENIDPSYLEVAFENTCNFKCSYCAPDISSRWMEEIQAHGSYILSDGSKHHDLEWLKKVEKFPIHHNDPNPYIDAFWKWWPDLYKSLNVFRITGGEPLLSKNTWKVVDFIEQNPRDDLEFSINTNMGVPRKLIDKLIDKVNIISPNLRKFTLYTSTEGVGPQQEYSRFGMIWSEFKKNCEDFLAQTPDDVRMTFMTTINVFSVSTFDKFMDWVAELRQRFNKNRANSRVDFSVNYLRWPSFLALMILNKDEKSMFINSLQKAMVKANNGPDISKLYLHEIEGISRLIDYLMSTDVVQQKNLADFSRFIDQYDKRRDVNFHSLFPELEGLYERSKVAAPMKILFSTD